MDFKKLNYSEEIFRDIDFLFESAISKAAKI